MKIYAPTQVCGHRAKTASSRREVRLQEFDSAVCERFEVEVLRERGKGTPWFCLPTNRVLCRKVAEEVYLCFLGGGVFSRVAWWL